MRETQSLRQVAHLPSCCSLIFPIRRSSLAEKCNSGPREAGEDERHHHETHEDTGAAPSSLRCKPKRVVVRCFSDAVTLIQMVSLSLHHILNSNRQDR